LVEQIVALEHELPHLTTEQMWLRFELILNSTVSGDFHPNSFTEITRLLRGFNLSKPVYYSYVSVVLALLRTPLSALGNFHPTLEIEEQSVEIYYDENSENKSSASSSIEVLNFDYSHEETSSL